MLKRLTLFFLAFAILLTITGCSERSLPTGESSTLNDVTLEILSCRAETVKDSLFDRHPCTGFPLEARITNNSTDEVTKVTYVFEVLDKNGNVLYSFDDLPLTTKITPLAPGDSVTFTARPQREMDGKAASVRAVLKKAVTAEEMPLVHIPEPGEDFAAALNNEHLRNISAEPPVKIDIHIDHGGPAEIAELTDPAEIAEFLRHFSEVRIEGETNEMVTDNYNGFKFTFADGETVSFSLNLKNLEFSTSGEYHIFTLANFDGLWKYMNSVAEYPEDSE